MSFVLPSMSPKKLNAYTHTPKALHIRFITAKQKYYLLKVPFINLTLKATELYDGIMQIRDV